MRKKILIISISLLLFFGYLFFRYQFNFSNQYIYQTPENINDGLNTGSLVEVGINKELIVKAVDRIKKGKTQRSSLNAYL